MSMAVLKLCVMHEKLLLLERVGTTFKFFYFPDPLSNKKEKALSTSLSVEARGG